jgi:signal transduction histidine kinase
MDRYQLLYELAPLALPNFRVRRYHGDDLCLPISAFVEEDRERLRALYGFLQRLEEALLPSGDAPVAPRVMELLRLHPPEEILNLVQPLGRASYAAAPLPTMAKTIHDLRGGGLTALLGQLDLTQRRPLEESTVNALHFLTRDHLKIMRNALLGLDDAKRNEDLQPKIHGTDFIVQKWRGASLRGQGRVIRLEVDCPLPTPISECCVEFGALDRILYNLINNACRHAASDCIRLVLLPVPDDGGKDLRFILSNVVSPQALQRLSALNLSTLFEEGTSTTGSGFGLAIACDFVAHAYGLASHDQAIEGGYLGAAIIEDSFAAWFHWPRILQD